MAGKSRSHRTAWEIEGVSKTARLAAEKAAADIGAPIGVWLSDTVLRACQEGAIEPVQPLPPDASTKSKP